MNEYLLIFLLLIFFGGMITILTLRIIRSRGHKKTHDSSQSNQPIEPIQRSVDCAVSDWSKDCSTTPPYQRTRTVIVPQQGNGKACPSLIQPCCQRQDINSGNPFSEIETPATQCTNVRNLNYNARAYCKDGVINVVNDPIWCK